MPGSCASDSVTTFASCSGSATRIIATKSQSPVTDQASDTPSISASCPPSVRSASRSARIRTTACVTRWRIRSQGLSCPFQAARTTSYDRWMRRLLLLVCAIVLVDTSFYAAITPLLPYYADHEGLTKTSAGLLVGSYAAGTLIPPLPAGGAAVRFGPRAVLASGLGLLAGSSLAFGLAHSIVLLDV